MPLSDSPRAVLLDLFNTLVPGGSQADRDCVSKQMADELGVDRDAFASLVRSTFDARTRGRLGDLRETTRWMARNLGGAPSEDSIERATALRVQLTRDLHSKTWAIPTLSALRSGGMVLGLVSDCSAETPMIWPSTALSPYFQAVSFSCVTGHRKPEPAAYLVASDALGVEPRNCVFVGDGGSRELSGAAALGMTAIRFLPPSFDRGEVIDNDPSWAGPGITDLFELVTFGAGAGKNAVQTGDEQGS